MQGVPNPPKNLQLDVKTKQDYPLEKLVPKGLFENSRISDQYLKAKDIKKTCIFLTKKFLSFFVKNVFPTNKYA